MGANSDGYDGGSVCRAVTRMKKCLMEHEVQTDWSQGA